MMNEPFSVQIGPRPMVIVVGRGRDRGVLFKGTVYGKHSYDDGTAVMTVLVFGKGFHYVTLCDSGWFFGGEPVFVEPLS